MARPRVNRHDAHCPEYGSNWMPKYGASKGRRVYHCNDCGRRTIPDAAHQRTSAAAEERARLGYVSNLSGGSSLSPSARIIGVSVLAGG